jgi:hypothetical protein
VTTRQANVPFYSEEDFVSFSNGESGSMYPDFQNLGYSDSVKNVHFEKVSRLLFERNASRFISLKFYSCFKRFLLKRRVYSLGALGIFIVRIIGCVKPSSGMGVSISSIAYSSGRFGDDFYIFRLYRYRSTHKKFSSKLRRFFIDF